MRSKDLSYQYTIFFKIILFVYIIKCRGNIKIVFKDQKEEEGLKSGQKGIQEQKRIQEEPRIYGPRKN